MTRAVAQPASARPSLAARGAAGLLVAYKRIVSPLLPPSCRYTPTCSEYARLAVLRYGVVVGGARTVRRVLSCHPFAAGGVDLP